MNKWLKTILFLVASVFLTRFIPFSSLFRNLDTMIHEFGHALMTLLLSGKVLRIELYADHSGVTYSSMLTPGRSILVSLAGYVTASLLHGCYSIYTAKGCSCGARYHDCCSARFPFVICTRRIRHVMAYRFHCSECRNYDLWR